MRRTDAIGKTLTFNDVLVSRNEIVFTGNKDDERIEFLVLMLDDNDDMKLYEQINTAVIANWMETGKPFPVTIDIK